MLPITRATVNKFCIVCLQVPESGDTKQQNYNLNHYPQLLRVFDLMATGKLMNLTMPKQLCHTCYTKLVLFCKFGEMSVCSSTAFNELMEGDNKAIIKKNSSRICILCFKLKPDNSTSILTQLELHNLLELIFQGMHSQQPSFEALQLENICVLCTQKSKTFLEFQSQLQESHLYLNSILSHADDLSTENSPRILRRNTSDRKPDSKADQTDIFGNDNEPEIDNVILLSENNEKSDPFELSDTSSKYSTLSNERGIDTLFSRCKKCNRTFRKLSSYQSHKCRAGNSTDVVEKDEDVFTCNLCRKDYKTKVLLRTHTYRVHCKANKNCPYCQREFKQKHHLNDHIRLVHEGVRPHKCSYCDKSFGLPKTLRVHLMGHTNQRPFQCDICPKTFRQKAELNRHIKNHSSDMQFRCPVCSQGKATQAELDEHLTRHNNRDGFQCSKCGRKFTKLCHLKNHDDAVHLKLRPFKCDHDDCGKAFAARKTLQTHQLTHSGGFLNICNVCHKEFNCKANLLRHFYMHKTKVKREADE